MRCPSCGTDNAPDSRFCGGCGTRFAVSGQRVAPTEKISDDARFPQHQAASGAGSAVPITAPGVVAPRAIPAGPFMPQGAPPAQRPLAGGSASPRSSPRAQAVVVDDPRDATRGGVNRPAVPGERGREGPLSIDPSLSLPIAARRPWALIVVVLLIDLGLAGAGIWMLAHGLADRSSRTAPPRSGELHLEGTSRSSLTVPAGAAPSPPRPS